MWRVGREKQLTKEEVPSIISKRKEAHILVKIAKTLLGFAGVVFGLALTLLGIDIVARSVK